MTKALKIILFFILMVFSFVLGVKFSSKFDVKNIVLKNNNQQVSTKNKEELTEIQNSELQLKEEIETAPLTDEEKNVSDVLTVTGEVQVQQPTTETVPSSTDNNLNNQQTQTQQPNDIVNIPVSPQPQVQPVQNTQVEVQPSQQQVVNQ